MGRKKQQLPKYGTVIMNGVEYFRTRIEDADGKRVALYAKTPQELYDKVQEAKRKIKENRYRKENPTVKEYCDRWLMMQSAKIRSTTLADYRSKIKLYIVKPLGHQYMSDVTQDDVRIALLAVSQKSSSVYRCVHMLYKAIFDSALQSDIISKSPCERISSKGGVQQKAKDALTDDEVSKLLDAIAGLPTYTFVMIGLYAGLRREEILALKWDCVFLNTKTPYISVRRAWHTEHNRPVISDELKTKASKRDIPIPKILADHLLEVKKCSVSEYVISDREGKPLSYTQFRHLWRHIERRTVKEREYIRYVNGEKIKKTITPSLGESPSNNKSFVYSLDFHVTPHQLRHTYITNLIYASVDPKTVQYLAGHENSKITMDIYAKVKYNKPKELSAIVNKAFEK